MHAIFDLVDRVVRPPDVAGSAALLPLGYRPKARIVVPSENDLALPSDPQGFACVSADSSAVLGLELDQSNAMRSLVISRPGMVFPLPNPSVEELEFFGLTPGSFRSENPRRLGLGAAFEIASGGVAYGVAKLIALENGLRMGSTNLLSFDVSWTSDVLEAEELLLDLATSSKVSMVVGPEPKGTEWKRVVVLLGGAGGTAHLPMDWRRQMTVAAGLRRVILDIRPNPESARARIVHELTTKPPDGLLVWADYLPRPEAFTLPYSAARPGGLVEFLGTPTGDMSFEEHKIELLMHLRQVSPLELGESQDRLDRGWDEVSLAIRDLEGEHFRLSDRALSMLVGNPYPKPERMFDHVRSLSVVAEAYRAADGRLSSGLKDFAMATEGIEIALFDGNLNPPAIYLEGVLVRDSNGQSLRAEPHVKVDDYKSPEQCGRIYFAIDKSEGRFVVDHIGLHDY